MPQGETENQNHFVMQQIMCVFRMLNKAAKAAMAPLIRRSFEAHVLIKATLRIFVLPNCTTATLLFFF